MKTFEQQLREYVEWRARQAYPSNIEKQCILQNGAELLLPMMVELYSAAKNIEDKWFMQKPVPKDAVVFKMARIKLREAVESIQKQINGE